MTRDEELEALRRMVIEEDRRGNSVNWWVVLGVALLSASTIAVIASVAWLVRR